MNKFYQHQNIILVQMKTVNI